MELLVRYLERSDRRVHMLVRARDDDAAEARVRGVLANLFGERGEEHAHRVQAVRGDLTRPLLGRSAAELDALAEQVGDVIHAAASVSFASPLEEARASNVRGTERILDLAERCERRGGLASHSHVSTAFVAGARSGTAREEELDRGQGFRNAYERSKLEAEQLVRERMGTIPAKVFRPSIVVGEERSGWTASFNVLYTPLRAYSLGLRVAPARRSTPVDAVSVDYVADAVFALATDPATTGGTYQLVSGGHSTTVG